MGRIIGTGGSGTKRITNATRSEFKDSSPYLRGDRATNSIRLTARGKNARQAVQFMLKLVIDEQNWALGATTVCPHPHTYVPVDNPEHVRHVIGQGGSGLREVSTRAGMGVFIVHKPDLGSYLVEASSVRDVDTAKSLLLQRIQRIAEEQITAQTSSDGNDSGVSTATGDKDRFIEKTYTVPARAKPGETVTWLSTPWNKTIAIKVPDGHHPGDRFTVKIPCPTHTTVAATSGFTSSREYNLRHKIARETLAQDMECAPYQVNDRQIQSFLRAQEKHMDCPSDASSNMSDTISTDSENFPSMQSTLNPRVTLKVSEIDQRMAAIDAELQADRLVGEQELDDLETEEHLEQYHNWLNQSSDAQCQDDDQCDELTSPPKEFYVNANNGYISETSIPVPCYNWATRDNIYTFSATIPPQPTPQAQPTPRAQPTPQAQPVSAYQPIASWADIAAKIAHSDVKNVNTTEESEDEHKETTNYPITPHTSPHTHSSCPNSPELSRPLLSRSCHEFTNTKTFRNWASDDESDDEI